MSTEEEAGLDPQFSEEQDSEFESESESDWEDRENIRVTYKRADGKTYQGNLNTDFDVSIPENVISFYAGALKRKKRQEWLDENEKIEDEEQRHKDSLFDFPPDPENWQEGDLGEIWADGPLELTKPGWDPNWVNTTEKEYVDKELKAGRTPPIAPFYVPFRKHNPIIPKQDSDINNPKAVIEEMDRVEEFLIWVSYIFPDGSTYEGTAWDDLAHGKGVFVAEQGLVRYEGEWLQNSMEGHGVVEVDIPTMQPIPGSALEAKMRKKGQIITRDFMTPEDRKWLEMDIKDHVQLSGVRQVPFYENEEWVKQFGRKPEKGRYRYAGQWKHGRMHGCGVYEVNERTTFGRFYFGDLLSMDTYGCDEEVSALHAGIAEVAAAKARMFVNKPDGMIREDRGPYSDPQHPYLYEEDDLWMAPGFINKFFEVPDYWKAYVREVDQEREMWLNSFYKSPLRIPMPSELEYWWEKEEEMSEFELIYNKEPEPDPKDPTKHIFSEGPLILHTPTGRIINYSYDEEHGIRMFWQPPEGEDVDPDFEEGLVVSFTRRCKSILDGLVKWTEKRKEDSKKKREILQQQLELVDAKMSLKEAIEDLYEELEHMEKEDENKVDEEEEVEEQDKDTSASEPTNQQLEKKTPPEAEEDEEDEEEDNIPSSFGSIEDDQKSANSNSGKSTFAAVSLSFAGSNLASLVPQKLQNSFLRWKEGKFHKSSATPLPLPLPAPMSEQSFLCTVRFRTSSVGKSLKIRYAPHGVVEGMPKLRLRKQSSSGGGLQEPFNILSLHTPVKMY